MYLQKIHIQNFKSYENVTIHFNKDINIFTGANNSGKTTVLEAIALWNECFEKLITQIGKSDTKKNLQRGDFMLGTSQPKYTPHHEIVGQYLIMPAIDDVQSLKGLLRKPKKPVSIADMNVAIRQRGVGR